MKEIYKAIVRKTDATDPKLKIKRGWIKVSCPDLLGDNETICPIWIKPRLSWGWFTIPDVGEMVDIVLTTRNDNDHVRGQTIIDAPDINWAGVRYYSKNSIPGGQETEINDAFKTNYGKRRGFCTPYGHTIIFDDTKGDSQVYITSVVSKHDPVSGKIVASDKINQIVLDKNGIKMSMLDSYTLQMSPEGTLELSLDGDNTLTINGADDATTAQIGDGAVHVAIVEHLNTLWDAMKGTLETWGDPSTGHTHPTAMGPSGKPIEKLTVDAWDPAIESTKVSIPDG